MDSVTQLVLGAAAGYAALGPVAGRRALVWGAALGTLPDLDVFLPRADPIAAFTEHRGFSHSLFVLAALVPACAALAVRLHPDTRHARRGWQRLTALVLGTHVLLDCFTVYGTQIFWPLPWAPESWSTIFVVDPAYTLPLAAGVLAAVWWGRKRPDRARRLGGWGLALSTAYLIWTCGAKAMVEDVVTRDLDRRGIQPRAVLTTPTPLNSILWRIVVLDGDGWLEGYHSLLADGEQVRWTRHGRGGPLLAALAEDGRTAHLDWFAHGFTDAIREGDDVVVRDLRMGGSPRFAFRFVLGHIGADGVVPVPTRQLPSDLSTEDLRRTWARIFDPTAPR
ncbi:MAG: metal-dependent hydrolase [Planctomycetota bacterium]|nr:metal-dependent hydrolase [Planctomycetota bacterium]MDA0934438.1 metal-dependent hydrolase [Planctomycetota bacterium]MDA1223227.1 metal-dependent hydrolase [Planctomycetota bacterium]